TIPLDTGEWHTPHSRRPCAERFPNGGFRRLLAHVLGRSPSSTREPYWITRRPSHRGASIYPDADQAARNVRRSGGNRARKRAAVPRTQRGLGTTDCD